MKDKKLLAAQKEIQGWRVSPKHTVLMQRVNDYILQCHDCHRPIVASDDDAFVCIQCGGRNRRLHVAVS